jgi:hypothetical protein
MVDSYPMTHCPHGKTLREHCDACEKVDLVEQHQQERVVQLETQVNDLCQWLQVILDHVDYTSGACNLTEPVGAVLSTYVIKQARAAIARAEGKAA